MTKTLITLVFGLFVFQKAQAQSESFRLGLVNYQNKKYVEAQAAFTDALKTSPDDAAVLTNLGLTAFQMGQKSWALAYFRKAMSLNPGLPAAQQGLNFVLSQVEVKEIPHQLETYELVRDQLLQPASEFAYLWILGALLFLLGWSFLKYLGQRKMAENEDLPFPAFPWVAVVSGFFSLVFLTLAVMKVYDLQIPRGTIVEEKVSVQSAPGENQLNLFELYGGFEVVLRSQSGDWVQVTYPGALTGWIKKKALYVTSGNSVGGFSW